MESPFLNIIPVLPSADIAKDIAWYKEKTGFEIYYADKMYAVLVRDHLTIHLQWHADTASDPLLGGSVIRFSVVDIHPILEEFIQRGTVAASDLRTNTPWKTNEFWIFRP